MDAPRRGIGPALVAVLLLLAGAGGANGYLVAKQLVAGAAVM